MSEKKKRSFIEEGMNSMLNPNYVVGFVGGEGCFSITVNRHHGRLFEVRLLFAIELEESDEEILRIRSEV